MKQFIELTLHNDSPILVNYNYIVHMGHYDGCTRLEFHNRTILDVKESVKDINSLISVCTTN